MDELIEQGVSTIYPINEIEQKRLDNTFTYHSSKNDQAKRYEILRDMAKQYATLVMILCPPSRERSIALTEIEESNMQANAAIARNE